MEIDVTIEIKFEKISVKLHGGKQNRTNKYFWDNLQKLIHRF